MENFGFEAFDSERAILSDEVFPRGLELGRDAVRIWSSRVCGS